jgi:hypothetical protein
MRRGDAARWLTPDSTAPIVPTTNSISYPVLEF